MGLAYRVGAALVVVGLVFVAVGAYLAANPSVVERISRVERYAPVAADRVTVAPLHYVAYRFTVPSGAQAPTLEVALAASDDVKLVVATSAGEVVYEEKVKGYAERRVPLPGPGSYELRLDNSFSLLTSKTVYVNATLMWVEETLERETVQRGVAPELSGLGVVLVLVGGVMAGAEIIARAVREFRRGLRGEG